MLFLCLQESRRMISDATEIDRRGFCFPSVHL